jgi:3,4-dihydroxy 2-butanone 4-phosphate synthase/GTP cyclohydrolase II
MPLAQGDFTLSVYPTRNGETEPPAVLIKDLPEKGKVTLRIHSQCLTGDSFGSRRCDCGEQLQTALKIISEEGGLLIHLPQEGRGIGLTEKIRAYKLQEQGLDTLEANIALGHAGDLRDYSSAVRILKHLGITEVELLTNNPEKAAALVEAGIKVDVRALQIPPHDRNRQYLTAKKEKMGHLLSL